MKPLLAVSFSFFFLLVPFAASADKPPEAEPELAPPVPTSEPTHLEFTMGFMGGQRSYKDSSFAYDEGAGSSHVVEAFTKAPFDTATVLGLRWDLRAVVSYVRMTIGFDLPFTQLDTKKATSTFTIDGKASEVTVQSIKPYELRFGLGGEYAFGRFVPYIDLVGTIHWVDTELSVDGLAVDYSARAFGFSARAGLRIYLQDWFFATVSGEAGILGPLTWNSELSVGFGW